MNDDLAPFCPWCGSGNTKDYLIYPLCGFDFKMCCACKVVFNIDERSVLDYRKYNAQAQRATSRLSIHINSRTQTEHLLERFQYSGDPPSHGRFLLLDVGCGPGDLLAAIRSSYPSAQLRGIDPSVHNVVTARKHHDVEIECGFWGNDHEGQYDYILMYGNLMLHNNPKESLRIAAKHLRPGGRLLCDVKNPWSATRRLLCWVKPFLPDIPITRHLYRQAFHGMPWGLTHTAIKEALATTSLRIIKIRQLAGRNIEAGTNVGFSIRLANFLDRTLGATSWIEFVLELPPDLHNAENHTISPASRD